MAELLRLRSYQQQALDAIHDAHFRGAKHPAVVIPTGGGKSLVFSHLAVDHLRDTGNRVLIIAHRDELVDGAIKEIRNVAPHLHVGKVKADDDEIYADVVVASVQTISRAGRLFQLVESQSDARSGSRPFGLVITDECHHSISNSYKAIYAAFRGALKVGVTATLARGDGVGLGSVISDVVFSRSILWMIVNGYLVDPVHREVTAESLDLSGIGRSGGDYAAGALGEAMIETGTGEVIARAYREYAADRQGVVFTPNVASAYDTARCLQNVGITAAVVDANTPREDRLSIYERSRVGDLQVMVNCGVLLEGFNAPWLSCVVPKMTWSEGSFQQQVGRGLRLYPGKTDCLVLSVGGVEGKLRTLIDLSPGEVRSIQPGETLTEAVEREEAEGNRLVPAGAPAFSLRARDTDLFAASASVWLRTDGGVLFIPTGDGEIVLSPGAEGTWQVRHAPRDTKKWPRLHDGLSLDMAMAYGEMEAEDRDNGTASLSRRNASWRRRKASPTPGQLAACRAWQITVPEGATKAQVSDLLSIRVASLRFDWYATRIKPSVTPA